MKKHMATPASSVRQKVHELADQLPADATWGDVRYQVELRASIERGLADSDAGRTTPHEEIVKEFGIAEATKLLEEPGAAATARLAIWRKLDRIGVTEADLERAIRWARRPKIDLPASKSGGRRRKR